MEYQPQELERKWKEFWIKNDIAGQLKLRTIIYFYYLTDTLLINIIYFKINYILQHHFQCLSLKVWGCDKRKTVVLTPKRC